MSWLVILLFLTLNSNADICLDWFDKLKIKNTPNCESSCRTSMVDMSSYLCKQQCDSLCKKPTVIADTNFYGLTDDEINFCIKNQVTCIKAYKLSWSAEKLCLRIYPYSDMNDESDACRHYIWAILLCRDIGEKDAEIILNAHEKNPKEPQNQQAMDLANNRLGLLNYQKNKNGFETDYDIKNSFLDQLKKNKFIIIKPNYPNSGGTP